MKKSSLLTDQFDVLRLRFLRSNWNVQNNLLDVGDPHKNLNLKCKLFSSSCLNKYDIQIYSTLKILCAQ